MPQSRPQFHFSRRCGDFGTFALAREEEARTSAASAGDDDVEVLEETDAEEIAADRRGALCIIKGGRPATRAFVPRLVSHTPDAPEPGRTDRHASEDAESRDESANDGQAEDGDHAESDDDLLLTQALTRHRILVAANHDEVRDALEDFCDPDWRDEPCILREHPVDERVCDSGLHSAEDSADSDDETTGVLLELHRMVTGNLEEFLKTVERRSEEERHVEHRLTELLLAKEHEKRQISVHGVEINQLTDRLKTATKLERQEIVERVGDLEAATTTCEEEIHELRRQEEQLLARRDRLRRKALNRALFGLLREATVDAQHRQLILLIVENAALRDRLQRYEALEDAEPCASQIAAADETIIYDAEEDQTNEGHGFSNASLPSSWTPVAGSRTHHRSINVVSQSREIVDVLLRTFIVFLWTAIVAYAAIFLYFINVSNAN